MIVIASGNGRVGIDAAWEVLAAGGSALDAVEVGTRLVEDDPNERTVGYGGYPNADGVVELDASIMDGTTRRAGGVCALVDYRAAITVARAVMERTPHVLLAGDGAAQLAAEIGLHPEDLRLPGAPDKPTKAGTVDFLAIDAAGHIASAVSTSGWPGKRAGRVGDSPIIGAGNYCDDRIGGAACTGLGELAMRAGTARMIVAAMEHGRLPADACERALADLPDDGVMHVVVLGRDGTYAAATNRDDGATFVVRADGMTAYEERPRTFVSP